MDISRLSKIGGTAGLQDLVGLAEANRMASLGTTAKLQNFMGLKAAAEANRMASLGTTAKLQSLMGLKAAAEANRVASLGTTAKLQSLIGLKAAAEANRMASLGTTAKLQSLMGLKAAVEANREASLGVSSKLFSAFDKNVLASLVGHNFDKIETLQDRQLLEPITNLADVPYDENIIVNNEQQYYKSVANVDIAKEITDSRSFSELSEAAKKLVLYVITTILIPTLIMLYSVENSETNKILNNILAEIKTKNDVAKIAKHPPVSKVYLKDIRIVNTYHLNLRSAPAMKSIILETLSLGQRLTILDNSNRSWLYVLVEVEGSENTIEGWVSRRYTSYFK